MKIVELENKSKYIIIDSFIKNEKAYLLVSKLINDTISDESNICIYNEHTNTFEEVDEEYDVIKETFEKRFNKYNFIKNMKQLKIVKIENYDYYLKDDIGNTFIKNIEFIKTEKPTVNDIIYMSDIVVKERNIFTYGPIYDEDNIDEKNIIKVKTKKNEYLLQRYYG